MNFVPAREVLVQLGRDELLDRVVRDEYGGDPTAKALLLASGDRELTLEDRLHANEQLVALQRERLHRERGDPPIDANTWEGSPLKGVDLGIRDKRPEARGGLRLRTVADLATRAAATVTWLLDRIIPADGALVLLSAYMKVGKSTLLYAFIAAVLRGTEFLGLGVKHGPVILLGVEELDRDILIRLRAFGVRDADPLHVHVGPLPDSADTWKALRARIAEIRPVLLVVDTLNRFWSVRDENDNAQVNREAGKWLELARETGVTILLVVHSGKGEGDHGRSIRGASALFALADQALLLDRRRGGSLTQRSIKILGRYQDSPPELVLDFNAGAWSVLGTPQEADTAAAVRKLVECITSEPRPIGAVADEAEVSQRMARKLVRKVEGVVIEGAGTRGDPLTVRWA